MLTMMAKARWVFLAITAATGAAWASGCGSGDDCRRTATCPCSDDNDCTYTAEQAGECFAPICVNGGCDVEPAAAGTTCSSGVCDGSGTCVPDTGTGGSGGTGGGAGATGGAGGAEPTCATAIDVGAGHTCAVRPDGTLWCWGSGASGEIGDGTTSNKITPVPVAVLGSEVAGVKLGGSHTCARKVDGTIWCWGWNMFGQLGDGNTTNLVSPSQVASLSDSARVALGGAHSCAIASGAVWCWGWNVYGQLGDGTTADKATPVSVTGLNGASSLDLGDGHSCALVAGELYCWGHNDAGQLGDGTTTDRLSPIHVATLGDTVVEVALGASHTCARRDDGSTWCWGSNESGQLGLGSLTDQTIPTQVAALAFDVVGLAAGGDNTCARRRDGSLWCWGKNTLGQVGDGTTVDKTSPVEITTLPAGAVDVALGDHGCALAADDAVYCWGINAFGQLGDGTMEAKTSPTKSSLCP